MQRSVNTTNPQSTDYQIKGLKDQNNQLIAVISQQQSSIDTLNDLLGKTLIEQKNISENITNLNDKQEKLENTFNNDKIKSMEVISIFVAIIGFVSMEVTLLSKTTSAILFFAISLVIMSGFIMFCWILFILIDKTIIKTNDLNKNKISFYKKQEFWVIIIFVILISISFGLVFNSEKICQKIDETQLKIINDNNNQIKKINLELENLKQHLRDTK